MIEIPRFLGVENDKVFHNLVALESVINAYDPKHYQGRLPDLPKPWKALSVGGDESKLCAVAPQIGLFVKRYSYDEVAKVVFENYALISTVVLLEHFPLCLPIALYKDALIFTALQHNGDGGDDFEAAEVLQAILYKYGIVPELDRAHFLTPLYTPDGIVYVDPFIDQNYLLEMCLKQRKNNRRIA